MDVRERTVDFATKAAEAAQAYNRWTVLWRSIILSSLDNSPVSRQPGSFHTPTRTLTTHPQTYKPYCRYLRMLDFRNLHAMLEDSKFTGPTLKAFFAKGLNKFHFPRQEFKRQTVDLLATLNAVGDALTLKTSQIEEIAGHLSPGFLPRWISRSPKLQTIVLFTGDALATGAGQAIAEHCEQFRNLTVREWTMPDADDRCATFLNELLPDTLSYFEMISYNVIGSASFAALGRHGRLQELKLSNLNQEAIQNLNQLKGCTEIHTLSLEDNSGTVQLEALNNDVFVEFVRWLSSCSKLRDLTLKKFLDGPTILSQILPSPTLRLSKLSLEGYLVRQQSSRLFHSALSEQKSLESIWLKGNGEDTVPDDLQIMVEGLCNITNLKELVLKDVSDEFSEDHIAQLALSLPLLEDFWTSGDVITGNVLSVLGGLRHLRNLTLYALTTFKCDEIIDFLGMLDPTSQSGFSLFLMAADPFDGALSEGEQDLIRNYVRANLDGRFDFVLWREADTSDSEDD